jgi:hypothetical protein
MFGIDRPRGMTSTPEGASTASSADLDSSSALVRAEADHLDSTLHALVTRLGSVPGLNISVSYRHGKLRRFIGDLPYINDLNRRTGPIQRISVVVGGDSYWLRRDRETIRCGRDPVPAQPDPAVPELTFSAWAEALFNDVAGQNLVNHDSLVALRQLVEYDRIG